MFSVRDAAFAAAMSLANLGGAVLSPSLAEMTVEVGGAPMYPSKNIIENAINSKDHTTLVAALKAAGLVETLESDGPFTVFAPVNSAFDKLPKGMAATLLKPENKAALTAVHSRQDFRGRFRRGGPKERRRGHLQNRRRRRADRAAKRPQTRNYRRQGQ
jgi:hypothetical protein